MSHSQLLHRKTWDEWTRETATDCRPLRTHASYRLAVRAIGNQYRTELQSCDPDGPGRGRRWLIERAILVSSSEDTCRDAAEDIAELLDIPVRDGVIGGQ